MKTKILASTNAQQFENEINKFIKDKKVIDIKFFSVFYNTKFDMDGIPIEGGICDRALILYEELMQNEQ